MSIHKLISLLITTLLLISCKNDKQEIHIKKKVIPKTINKIIIKDDTIFKNDSMIVVKNQQSTDTAYYFHSELGNEKFKVKVENIKLKKELDFSNYEYKKMFATAIREGVEEEGVNFAGKFCFVYWGCGSPCQSSAVVDINTGIVYNGIPSAVGYKFKKESKILVVNPPEDSTNYYPKHRWVNYPTEYIWTGKKFIQISKTSR